VDERQYEATLLFRPATHPDFLLSDAHGPIAPETLNSRDVITSSWQSERVRCQVSISTATQPPYSLLKITGVLTAQNAGAREALGRPRRRELGHALWWECGYKRLELA
jgi:hypothetical protein